MCTADQIDVVLLVELANHVLSECKADSSVIVSIGFDATLRIRPEQVAEQTSVGYISRPHNVLNLVQVLQLRAETTVHAEDFLVNESSDRQTVENVTENAPESDGVSTLALVIEPVNAIDLSTLVIASQQEEVLGVLNLVAQQKAHCFNRLLSAVNVVTKEEVIGLGREASILEDPQQVIVLSMDVTYTSKLRWSVHKSFLNNTRLSHVLFEDKFIMEAIWSLLRSTVIKRKMTKKALSHYCALSS